MLPTDLAIKFTLIGSMSMYYYFDIFINNSKVTWMASLVVLGMQLKDIEKTQQ